MLQRAIEVATKYHSKQQRKHLGPALVKLPYIVHPIDVMKKLWEWSVGDETMLCAAACHDILEDRPDCTVDVLATVLTRDIAVLVEEMTFIPPSDPSQKQAAKAAYIRSFLHKSIHAVVLKLADRFCNVSDYCLSRPDYASTYFHKADDLFCIWRDRKGEVIEAFGPTTQASIEYDIRELEDGLPSPAGKYAK